MHLKNTLSKFIFAYLVFCFHGTIAIANAPIDPTGHKIALKVTNSVDSEGNVDSEEETHIQFFISIIGVFTCRGWVALLESLRFQTYGIQC